MRHEGENLFSWTPGFGVLNPPPEEMIKTGYGGADIYEKDGELYFDIELPGLKKEDISVRFENNYLLVKGELKKDSQIQEQNYLRQERQSGLFQRNYPLPEEVDIEAIDNVKAVYQDGILQVKLPLKNNTSKFTHEIDIE
ncbi:Hsp20/alpha crystallin family protein [Natranaerobius trueperi]|uniref:Heat-shock protein n=1 Tax=Natranaerobius trueperi TaxID=759412 RepID=A0A226BV83_9FIRM|nr:Hsp20/alpha crystallin family protein [Natranaerobius trueperi]OWZ82906.1 heat-shock protein [Natranaerobius trueperi]